MNTIISGIQAFENFPLTGRNFKENLPFKVIQEEIYDVHIVHLLCGSFFSCH
jgi:hypothetical protein